MLYIIAVIGNYVIQMKKSDKALDLQYTSGKKDHADREVCILSTWKTILSQTISDKPAHLKYDKTIFRVKFF